MSKVSKVERREAILKIVKERAPGRQEDLVGALSALGVPATQATVSRDVKALGLHKVRLKDGRTVYRSGGEPVGAESLAVLRTMVRNFVRGTDRTGNLVVVKTSPGNAPGVASAIDHADVKGVLGTVAGDDTIIVVASDQAAARDFARELGGI